MSNICEVTAKAINVKEGVKCVDVFAYAKDAKYGDVTIAYELCGKDESALVYAGRINTEDPGEGPIEEYASRNDAIDGEYGKLFNIAITLADGIANN